MWDVWWAKWNGVGILQSTWVSSANSRSTKSSIRFICCPGQVQCAIYGLYTKILSLTHPQNKNKKLWEELIASFPVIRHGPHRKRLQQFLVAAGTSLRGCYLVTIGRHTYRTIGSPLIRQGSHRKWPVQQFFYRCVHSLPREHAYRAMA
jgi:hypothetical protein